MKKKYSSFGTFGLYSVEFISETVSDKKKSFTILLEALNTIN
jgi:hypothetical protein